MENKFHNIYFFLIIFFSIKKNIFIKKLYLFSKIIFIYLFIKMYLYLYIIFIIKNS